MELKEPKLFIASKCTYKPNSIPNQCLFCNNEALSNDDICTECKEMFEHDGFVEFMGGYCGKCNTYYAECACKY